MLPPHPGDVGDGGGAACDHAPLMRTPLVALLLALGLAACGSEGPGDGPHPARAPWLRRARTIARTAGADATLVLNSPTRVVLLYRRDGDEERTIFDVTYAGSQVVELSYDAREAPGAAGRLPVPPAEEQRKGRTAGHGFILEATIDDGLGTRAVEPTVWTRPDAARARWHALIPSRLGEEVPFDTDVELAAVVVVDGPAKTLTLTRKDGLTQAHVAPRLEPEDRLHVLRLILRVERAGDGRLETR